MISTISELLIVCFDIVFGFNTGKTDFNNLQVDTVTIK